MPMHRLWRGAVAAAIAISVLLGAAITRAQEADDLAKAAQNPVADLISLPFQNNTNFDVGPSDGVVNVLNIQPVIPVQLNEDWNLITRTIVPVVYQEELTPGNGNEFGLGDTTFTAFFSPRAPSNVTWGVGPVLLLPTSTDRRLGAGEPGGGISGVVLTMQGPVVAGALANNVWAFDGSVNQFLLQPFGNYNFQDGWYAVSAPIITADWEARSNERWTVPIGGGLGRVFNLGSQPVNASVQGYYNIETPTFGADWTLRLQLQLLFPK